MKVAARVNGSATDYRLLADCVLLADSGTWGDDAVPGTGNPVIRSSNMQGGQFTRAGIAYRIVPEKHRESKRLSSGDIVVTSSSGSSDLIGKCILFEAPGDGTDYYFSNFTLRLRTDPAVMDPRWLFHWLTSDRGRAELARINNTTSGLRNLNRGLYLQQRVPWCPLPEQKRIAAILDKADEIRRKRRQAIETANSLIPAIFYEMFGDPRQNTHGYPIRPLGDKAVALINPPGRRMEDESLSCSFVPMADVDEERGEIVGTQVRPYHEVKKGFTPFQNGDVLFAKITPCMQNGKAAIASGLANGIGYGSTEFHVLRPTDQTTAEWLFALVRLPLFRFQAKQSFTGSAGQQRVPAAFLQKYPVPVPPHARQLAFAARVAFGRRIQERFRLAASTSGDMFGALSQRAFQGDL